jgi:hypothetical protein
MYAVRRAGELRLFHSRWGALTIAWDAFWGPDNTLSFVETNDSVTDWFDDVWTEGALALDFDARRMTLMAGDIGTAEERAVYAELFGESWRRAGFSAHLVDTLQEVAAAVGVAAEDVTAAHLPPLGIESSRLGENLLSGNFCALASLRTADGWSDRVVDFSLPAILRDGPTTLAALHNAPTLGTICGTYSWDDVATRVREFAALDPATKSLVVDTAAAVERDDYLPYLEQDWPGWTVTWRGGGASEHFQSTGRSVPPGWTTLLDRRSEPGQLTLDECLANIQNGLFGVDTAKADWLMARLRMAEQIIRDDAGAVFAKGFSSEVPAVPASASERRALFDSIVEAVLRRYPR